MWQSSKIQSSVASLSRAAIACVAAIELGGSLLRHLLTHFLSECFQDKPLVNPAILTHYRKSPVRSGILFQVGLTGLIPIVVDWRNQAITLKTPLPGSMSEIEILRQQSPGVIVSPNDSARIMQNHAH
jgi:hypothetical protein